MTGLRRVDEQNPNGVAFLLLILYGMTFTFVCECNAQRSEKVTSKAPNLSLQVCGRQQSLIGVRKVKLFARG